MLQALGVSPEAESCYAHLFALKTATAEQLVDDRTDTASVIEMLEHLQDLGLATPVDDGGWQAIPLPEAVRVLRARRHADLDAAVLAADSFHLRLVAGNDSGTDGIQAIIGRPEVQGTMNRICSAAKTEIAAFDKPPYVTSRPPAVEWLESNSAEYQALDRGVSIRSVYHPGFNSDRLQELSLFIRHGERARTGDVPMKLVLVDHDVALIPSPISYAADQEVRATLIRHPILVEALQSLFEAVWDRSVSIVANDEGMSRDPRRGSLINLLMTGATDVAIASQLGVTERSVRRWIAEMMDELDVQTRLQLGAALARSDAIRSDMRALPAQHDRLGLN